MKKVFDQTVRDIKREVNKKVLKVPTIEQKVLDATSNEPWGPHGTLLAEIAQASRNYHEYQMIMGVIWKRINDTGKNWRHVYKALTVLEYLVGHGSERVIDEIREHAYQISTLSEFQYIDSSGRDQGSNVRKKSQSLVVLVNDKERIIEVRQKAAANRDKFRTASGGAMYRPGSYSSSGGYGERYDDDRYESRYGSRDEDRNGYGYGREREYSYKDDDRYGRYGDSNSRDGDRYSRDEDRYSRESYRDDDYRGRSQSAERYDDDGHSSSRGSGARADDQSQDGRKLERKFSEQNIAPPSYEEAVNGSRSPGDRERNGEVAASAPESSPPPAHKDASPPAPKAASPSAVPAQSQVTNVSSTSEFPTGQTSDVFDEFDPRGPGSAGPTATPPAPVMNQNNAEMDLLGALSDSFAPNPLAIMPAASAATTEAGANFSGSTSAAPDQAAHTMNQAFDDPFGDSPFKAIPISGDTTSPLQPTSTTATPFEPNQNTVMPTTTAPETANSTPFGDAFSTGDYSATTFPPASSSPQLTPQELPTSNQDIDILADILPPSGPSPAGGFSARPSQPAEPAANVYVNYNSQAGPVPPVAPNPVPQSAPFTGGNFLPHGSPVSGNFLPSQGSSQVPVAQPTPQINNAPFASQQSAGLAVPQTAGYTSGGPTQLTGNLVPQQGLSQPNAGNFVPQLGPTQPNAGNFVPQLGPTQPNAGNFVPQQQPTQPNAGNFVPQQQPTQPIAGNFASQQPAGLVVPQTAGYTAGGPTQPHAGNFVQQQGPPTQAFSSPAPQTASPFNNGNYMSQLNIGSAYQNSFSQGTNIPTVSQPSLTSSTGALAIVPQTSKDKFETKSTVWADTLSRGLVNLNISGPKTNPLADIGVDFEAINRKEKRMEKQPAVAPVSTVTMGKAMGSGSGMGRAGAAALRPSPNPMMNSGMGMGMGMGAPGSGMGMGMGGVPGSGIRGPGSGMGMGGPGMGMGGVPGSGMGGYGAMNQPGGMGMGMGMGAGAGMGMGMNMGMNRPMGMGQGMQPPPGSAMPGGYNPMMGGSGYGQQPYGGGYR